MTSSFLRTAVQHPPSQLGKLAKQRPRIARVDNVLDPEFLRRPERRTHAVQSLADRLQMRRRILRRLEFALVRDFDSALDRQAAPVARRPGKSILEKIGRANLCTQGTNDTNVYRLTLQKIHSQAVPKTH